MTAMFYAATSFNQDLDGWDVSAVLDMSFMFFHAYSFEHELCSIVWTNSSANKDHMFTHHRPSVCSSTGMTTDVISWGKILMINFVCAAAVAWVIILLAIFRGRWLACRATLTSDTQVSVEMSGAPLPVAEVIVRNPELDPSMTRVSVAGDTAPVADMQVVPVADTVQT